MLAYKKMADKGDNVTSPSQEVGSLGTEIEEGRTNMVAIERELGKKKFILFHSICTVTCVSEISSFQI